MKVGNVENVFILKKKEEEEEEKRREKEEKKSVGKTLGESYVAQVIVAGAAILYLVASISTLQISF